MPAQEILQLDTQLRKSQVLGLDNHIFIICNQKNTCKFYLKTGACRYGDSCAKFHPYPIMSKTLLFKNMYQHFKTSDEVTHWELYNLFYKKEEDERFREFYEDVFPEFEKFGKIVQFNV